MMESEKRGSLGRAKSCIRRPISILAICFVVVIVVVVIAEYFIVHAIDENDTTSDTQETEEAVDLLKIPDSWLLASATSAYQVEGAWNVSDKGPSMWDHYTHTNPALFKNATGDDACKSYEFYKTDVQMLVQTGFNAYRFSIAWSRVLPNGTADYISTDGMAYYNNLINELLAYNITPLLSSPVLLGTAIFPLISDIISPRLNRLLSYPAKLDKTKMLEDSHVQYY